MPWLLLASAQAACPDPATPAEAATLAASPLPGTAVTSALVHLDTRGCVETLGGTTTWTCTTAADGFDLSGALTVSGGTQTYAGVALALPPPADPAAYTLDRVYSLGTYVDTKHDNRTESVTESGTWTTLAGATSTWTAEYLDQEQTDHVGEYYEDLLTWTVTEDGCSVDGRFLDSGSLTLGVIGRYGTLTGPTHVVEVANQLCTTGIPIGEPASDAAGWLFARVDGGAWAAVDATTWAPPAVDEDGDGFSVDWGDCDDHDATVNTCGVECPNGVDDDCDGTVDGPDAQGWYPDADHDGHGDASATPGCPAEGWVTTDDDCDDADAAVQPGAAEIWYDGVDQDCDGDDADQDGDGVAVGEDCDDLDPRVQSCDSGSGDSGDGDSGAGDNGAGDNGAGDSGPGGTGDDPTDTSAAASPGACGCASGSNDPGAPLPGIVGGLLGVIVTRRRRA